MALPSVGQAQLLGTALQRTIAQFQPGSLAVLGVAGGNGLEFAQRAGVRRLVALDFNPDYLALCTRRYATSFAEFEPVLHDLSQGPPVIAPVECIFAGLVLEYLCVASFCGWLASLLTNGGAFAVLLQLPSPTLPEVSPSPLPVSPVWSPHSPSLIRRSCMNPSRLTAFRASPPTATTLIPASPFTMPLTR